MESINNVQEEIGNASRNSETIESKGNASAMNWMCESPQNLYVEAPMW